MIRSRISRAGVAVALLAFGVRAEGDRAGPATSAQGEGSRPGTGFDPTGSHPLPNPGVEGQSSKSTCGCNAVGRRR